LNCVSPDNVWTLPRTAATKVRNSPVTCPLHRLSYLVVALRSTGRSSIAALTARPAAVGTGNDAVDHRSHDLAPSSGSLGRPAPTTPQKAAAEQGAHEDQHRAEQRRRHDTHGEPAHDDDQESWLKPEDRCHDDE
jgi:hypothetical protein